MGCANSGPARSQGSQTAAREAILEKAATKQVPLAADFAAEVVALEVGARKHQDGPRMHKEKHRTKLKSFETSPIQASLALDSKSLSPVAAVPERKSCELLHQRLGRLGGSLKNLEKPRAKAKISLAGG